MAAPERFRPGHRRDQQDVPETSGDRTSQGVGTGPNVRWRESVCMVMLVSCSDLESKPGPSAA